MMLGLLRKLKVTLLVLAAVGLTLLGVRAYDASQFPPLRAWHTYVPAELSPRDLDATDWNGYLKAEEALFASIRREVTDRLDPEDRVPVNRYFEGSPVR